MQPLLYTFLFLLQVSFIIGNPPVQLVCEIHNTTCLIAEARDMFGQLVEGYAPLHTEPLDTMYIDLVHIEGETNFDLRDLQVIGLKNAVIEDVSVDFSTKIFRLKFVTDFTLKSHYIASGSLLSMGIEGNGRYEMDLQSVYVDMIMSFDIVKDALGNDVMMLNKYTYTYDVRDGTQYLLENLYYGNKTASDTMHVALNQNWKALTIEFGKYALDPATEKIFNAIRIFSRARPLKEYLEY